MANPTEAATKGTMGFLVDEFPGLSSSAKAFVRHHPREARLAVAVALEAAAAQCETEDAEAADEVPEGLRPFVVRRGDREDILGVSEAAKRLEVSRTTVYDWVDRRTLIAWRSTKRGLSIPAAQILGTGRVVAGLADVVEAIGDAELAWAFLSQEWPFDDTAATPLTLLKAGRLDDVLGAAAGFGTSFA
jgi:excisionase family DNA binding protein